VRPKGDANQRRGPQRKYHGKKKKKSPFQRRRGGIEPENKEVFVKLIAEGVGDAEWSKKSLEKKNDSIPLRRKRAIGRQLGKLRELRLHQSLQYPITNKKGDLVGSWRRRQRSHAKTCEGVAATVSYTLKTISNERG